MRIKALKMLCKLLNVSSTNHFEDLHEDVEVDEGVPRELLEDVIRTIWTKCR